MKALSDMLGEAYGSWLSSISHCCAPSASGYDDRPRRSKFCSYAASPPGSRDYGEEVLTNDQDISEKPSIVVLREQPGFMPPPIAEPVRDQHQYGPSTRASGRERAPSKSFASGRSSFSVRKRFLSNGSSRRPQISAPSNFRHLHSESFRFPQQPLPPQRPRPASFRPLELSIYLPDNHLSPILPLFEYQDSITPPPPARLHRNPSRDEEDFTLNHERSYSSMSFHLPRRSPSTTYSDSPPRPPPKSRARAYTAPNVEMIVERIASAILEVEKLQERIDDVIERQSIYVSSRPSTAHSMALTMTGMEPMPSIPALPPAAPSFAERLNSPVSAVAERPHTAPTKPPVRIPHRAKTFNEASAAFATPPSSRPRTGDRPPPPPLPLVLRPPLRKKKSFSRVSTWLFPDGTGPHSRDMSVDSITNLPRPVKGREGFYQCINPAEDPGRRSFDTDVTVSTWETEDEERTVPTTWSPGSSAATKSPAAKEKESPLERMGTGTFGGKVTPGPRRESVGVAF
jgi:hypothetical protein